MSLPRFTIPEVRERDGVDSRAFSSVMRPGRDRGTLRPAMSAATTPAPSPLVALIGERREAIVERLAREARARGNPWNAMAPERLRAGVIASLTAIERDLETGKYEHYARHVAAIALPRLRAGLTAHDVGPVLADIARVLRELCRRLPGPGEQLEALEQVGLLMESTWASALSHFEGAMRVVLEDSHRAVLRELSSPIIPIHAGVLVVPLIGAIDRERGELLTATLLPAIAREHAFGVLLDVTGVPALDAEVAGFLVGITRAARLLGAEVFLVGVGPAIAATMVDAGLDLRGLVAFGTLQAGLEHVLALRGLVVQRRAGAPV